jgi:AraC family transcriptional regulator of adaptative response / DNA-3-methyladenine glycosylase II
MTHDGGVSTTELDPESCYRAVKARDRRFDGVFYTAVRTTGIYCRPSCPARTPGLANVTFHRSAAAAQAAGYRACKRCLPDATPGSPDWDVAADAAGRAMRLIADGVVDREGVPGLASRVGYTSRHLTRIVTHELGAGPLALARARRAQTARILIQTTALGYADIAFASGFASVRQFNDTIREVYAATPSGLRGRRGGPPATGSITMRLAVRTPYDGRHWLKFMAVHAIAGVEATGDDWYARTLALPHGTGTVRLEVPHAVDPGETAFATATFSLSDLRDIGAAVERTRRMLDADCDPVAVSTAFAGDPVIGALVRRSPGLRVPGHVDGNEVAVRTLLGQQVTLRWGCTLAERLTAEHGRQVVPPAQGPAVTDLFPEAATLAGLDPDQLPMPRSRGRALVALCGALADGSITLDRGTDRGEVRRSLLALPGIGPWTADLIALRALGHPDVFLPTDIGTRNALRLVGARPDHAGQLADGWRPWRSYAQLHLWSSLPVLRVDTEES